MHAFDFIFSGSKILKAGFFLPRDYDHDATADVWSSVLRVAHKWGFDKVKALAVRELEKTQMMPVDKAVLARDCEVGNDWLVTAYAELGARESPLTREEGQRLGLDAVIQLAEVRERIRDRRSCAHLPLADPIPLASSRFECPSPALSIKPDERVERTSAWAFGSTATVGYPAPLDVPCSSPNPFKPAMYSMSDVARSVDSEPASPMLEPKQVELVSEVIPYPAEQNEEIRYTDDDLAITRSVFHL